MHACCMRAVSQIRPASCVVFTYEQIAVDIQQNSRHFASDANVREVKFSCLHQKIDITQRVHIYSVVRVLNLLITGHTCTLMSKNYAGQAYDNDHLLEMSCALKLHLFNDVLMQRNIIVDVIPAAASSLSAECCCEVIVCVSNFERRQPVRACASSSNTDFDDGNAGIAPLARQNNATS
jgi:hypothetical protein